MSTQYPAPRRLPSAIRQRISVARSHPTVLEGTVKMFKRGQSTLEWVIGAAIILGTLVVGIMAWNNGLVSKIGQMVQRLSQTT
jgi:hypothetical protein